MFEIIVRNGIRTLLKALSFCGLLALIDSFQNMTCLKFVCHIILFFLVDHYQHTSILMGKLSEYLYKKVECFKSPAWKLSPNMVTSQSMPKKYNNNRGTQNAQNSKYRRNRVSPQVNLPGKSRTEAIRYERNNMVWYCPCVDCTLFGENYCHKNRCKLCTPTRRLQS